MGSIPDNLHPRWFVRYWRAVVSLYHKPELGGFFRLNARVPKPLFLAVLVRKLALKEINP
jgi:hypothetical protein